MLPAMELPTWQATLPAWQAPLADLHRTMALQWLKMIEVVKFQGSAEALPLSALTLPAWLPA